MEGLSNVIVRDDRKHSSALNCELVSVAGGSQSSKDIRNLRDKGAAHTAHKGGKEGGGVHSQLGEQLLHVAVHIHRGKVCADV